MAIITHVGACRYRVVSRLDDFAATGAAVQFPGAIVPDIQQPGLIRVVVATPPDSVEAYVRHVQDRHDVLHCAAYRRVIELPHIERDGPDKSVELLLVLPSPASWIVRDPDFVAGVGEADAFIFEDI